MDNVPNIGSVPFTPRPAQDKPDLKAPKTTSDFELLIEQVDSTDSEQQGRRRAQVQPEDDTEENDTSSGFAQQETPPQPALRRYSQPSYSRPSYAKEYELNPLAHDLPEPLSYGEPSSSSSSGAPSTQASPAAENAPPRRRRVAAAAQPRRSKASNPSPTPPETEERQKPVKGPKTTPTRKSGRARMEALMAPPQSAQEQAVLAAADHQATASAQEAALSAEGVVAAPRAAKKAVKKAAKTPTAAATAQAQPAPEAVPTKTKATKKAQGTKEGSQDLVAPEVVTGTETTKKARAPKKVAEVPAAQEGAAVKKESKSKNAPAEEVGVSSAVSETTHPKGTVTSDLVAESTLSQAPPSPTKTKEAAQQEAAQQEAARQKEEEATAGISFRSGLLYLAEAAVQHVTPAPNGKGHASKMTPLEGRPLPHPNSHAQVNVQGQQSALLNPNLSVAIEGQGSVTTTTAIPKSAAIDRVIQAMRNALLTLVEKPGMRELSLTLRGVPGLAGTALEGLKITVQEYTTLAPGQYNITIEGNAAAQAMIRDAIPAMLAQLNQNTKGYTVQRLDFAVERPLFHRKGAAGDKGGGGDHGKEKG